MLRFQRVIKILKHSSWDLHLRVPMQSRWTLRYEDTESRNMLLNVEEVGEVKEGCLWVKGLGRGHTLTQVKLRQPHCPHSLVFQGREQWGTCCTWMDTKESQTEGGWGRLAKINIKASRPCPAFVAWKWWAPFSGVDEVRGKKGIGRGGRVMTYAPSQACQTSSGILLFFFW